MQTFTIVRIKVGLWVWQFSLSRSRVFGDQKTKIHPVDDISAGYSRLERKVLWKDNRKFVSSATRLYSFKNRHKKAITLTKTSWRQGAAVEHTTGVTEGQRLWVRMVTQEEVGNKDGSISNFKNNSFRPLNIGLWVFSPKGYILYDKAILCPQNKLK